MGTWIFKEHKPGLKSREPTQGEFFSTDAIRSMAEALVRESVQNSLDANHAEQTITVRFHLANGSQALEPVKAQQYFSSAWPHFKAQGNGLDDVPDVDKECRYLLVEDFGTTGLTGDVAQWRHVDGVKNSFFYFFRTEGRSGKGEEDRGRWGIGKYVFPRSSRVNAFLTLTVRSTDSKTFVMGQAVLKSHGVGDRYFTPDGDFGKTNPDGTELVLPSDDAQFADQFRRDFSLSRTGEPGLSVVVPWVNDEITRDSLLMAVIEDYYSPILSGGLQIEVSDQSGAIKVTGETLREACKQLGADFEKRMLPRVDLAAWANDLDPAMVVRLNPANPKRPQWEDTLVPPEQLVALRERYRSGEKISIELPLTVREYDERRKEKTPRESYFRVYLMGNESSDGSPEFVREGITISDVRPRRTQGVQALVVIDRGPLATLLGDSENPAHTQWQKDREHFARKYVNAKSYIDFVSQSVWRFVQTLSESDQQPDRDLLRDIFFVPKMPPTPQAKDKHKPRKRNQGETVTPDPRPEPRRKRYTLSKIAGGFTVKRGHPDALTPATLAIAVAYDRRRGSPLKKYSPDDFALNKAPISVECEGAEITHQQRNELKLRVVHSNFRVSVTGFDENRDLYVDVDPQDEDGTDDPQT